MSVSSLPWAIPAACMPRPRTLTLAFWANSDLKIRVHVMPEKIQAVFLSNGRAIESHGASSYANGSNAPHLVADIPIYIPGTFIPITFTYL